MRIALPGREPRSVAASFILYRFVIYFIDFLMPIMVRRIARLGGAIRF